MAKIESGTLYETKNKLENYILRQITNKTQFAEFYFLLCRDVNRKCCHIDFDMCNFPAKSIEQIPLISQLSSNTRRIRANSISYV